MRVITCKRCGTDGLTWTQDFAGRWQLICADSSPHKCPAREAAKTVTCKDCGASDLHWFENIMDDGSKRWMLTESFGLPHSCDERRKKLDAAKQEKRDFYAKEKVRIMADPKMPERAKKLALLRIRQGLWPQMKDRRVQTR
jgi:hypothetical protein